MGKSGRGYWCPNKCASFNHESSATGIRLGVVRSHEVGTWLMKASCQWALVVGVRVRRGSEFVVEGTDESEPRVENVYIDRKDRQCEVMGVEWGATEWVLPLRFPVGVCFPSSYPHSPSLFPASALWLLLPVAWTLRAHPQRRPSPCLVELSTLLLSGFEVCSNRLSRCAGGSVAMPVCGGA